jgi:hypothetical protein
LQRAKNAAVVGWLAYGTSCAEIRDQKFFEPQFDCWEDFCNVELHQSASQINRLIKGTCLAIELQQAGCQRLPTCERQVRSLGLLRIPMHRIQAWNYFKACRKRDPGTKAVTVNQGSLALRFLETYRAI